jgi:hypothetical protein
MTRDAATQTATMAGGTPKWHEMQLPATQAATMALPGGTPKWHEMQPTATRRPQRQVGHPNGTRCSHQPPDGHNGRRDTQMARDAATSYQTPTKALPGGSPKWHDSESDAATSHQTPTKAGGTPKWHEMQPPATSLTATMTGGTPKWHEMQLPATQTATMALPGGTPKWHEMQPPVTTRPL